MVAKIVPLSSMRLRVVGGAEIRTQQLYSPKTNPALGTFEIDSKDFNTMVDEILMHAHAHTYVDLPLLVMSW